MSEKISEYQKKVWQAMQYIEQHLDQTPDLEDVASKVYLSKYHFHRIFKIISGESVASYIRRIRLEKTAINIFSKQRQSITEIALDAGFSSSQNLAKALQKHFGVSAGDIRKCSDFKTLNNLLRQNSKNGNAPFAYPDYYSQQADQQEQLIQMQVSMLAAQRVAYVRAIGAYGTVEQMAYGKLMGWAGPKGLLAQGNDMLSICWDNPEITPAEKCRTDACIVVEEAIEPEGDVLIQLIPAGKYAQARSQINDKRHFKVNWDALVAKAMQQGYEVADDRPCFELYHAVGKDGTFDVTFNLAVN